MPAVQHVLVVGAGAAGTATAILLAERGITVDLVEREPGLPALGSGITLQGNALRVLRELGIWSAVEREGFAFDSLGLRAPDGTLLAEIPDVRTGGPDLPATAGMYRPALAKLLLDRAADAGARIRFGTTLTSLTPNGDAGLSDGTTHRYDLVVGADGIRSSTRQLLGVELRTAATGMGIWRAFTRRPASVSRTDLVYGGAAYIAGYCPTGPKTLYAYLVEDAQNRSFLSPAERVTTMRKLAGHYHGPWDEIRESLRDVEEVNYTWFETHLLEPPWHVGRVVLIGDAVHACPPTMAQGAALALEDAAVLAELLLAADGLDEDLWRAFTERRFPRVRTVVEASVQIGQWLLDHERGDVPGLMGKVAALVGEPA
jgi:2-polyprenyl-6-methoxyphenol hydroxylase-like FAD-dependent oxidoreductase